MGWEWWLTTPRYITPKRQTTLKSGLELGLLQVVGSDEQQQSDEERDDQSQPAEHRLHDLVFRSTQHNTSLTPACPQHWQTVITLSAAPHSLGHRTPSVRTDKSTECCRVRPPRALQPSIELAPTPATPRASARPIHVLRRPHCHLAATDGTNCCGRNKVLGSVNENY